MSPSTTQPHPSHPPKVLGHRSQHHPHRRRGVPCLGLRLCPVGGRGGPTLPCLWGMGPGTRDPVGVGPVRESDDPTVQPVPLPTLHDPQGPSATPQTLVSSGVCSGWCVFEESRGKSVPGVEL